MSNGVTLRESSPTDWAALEVLYPAAFPDEDLLPFLVELLREDRGVLSLVAVFEQAVVGHIAFTMCGLEGRSEKVALLGPLAVSPQHQRRGIGSSLIREGLGRMRDERVTRVLLLGDPAYYVRFGFAADGAIAPPYPLPSEWQAAWQSLSLQEPDRDLQGTLSVPRPWRQAALWGP